MFKPDERPPALQSLIDEMNREMKFEESDRQTDTLWHYTDASGIRGILTNREMWATHYAFLNDREEVTHGEAAVQSAVEELVAASTGDINHILRDFLQFWPGLKLTAHTDVYITSFCTDGGDRLSQWRGYGGAGAGYAVGFKSLPMLESVVPGPPRADSDGSVMLVKMTYSESEFRDFVKTELLPRAEILKRYCSAHHGFFQELQLEAIKLMNIRAATLALRLKHHTFSEEDEWRLVVMTTRRLDKDNHPVVQHRAGRGGGLVPYVPILVSKEPILDLEGIRVGPAQNETAALRGVKSLLVSLGYKTEDAERIAVKSKIPYRTW